MWGSLLVKLLVLAFTPAGAFVTPAKHSVTPKRFRVVTSVESWYDSGQRLSSADNDKDPPAATEATGDQYEASSLIDQLTDGSSMAPEQSGANRRVGGRYGVVKEDSSFAERTRELGSSFFP